MIINRTLHLGEKKNLPSILNTPSIYLSIAYDVNGVLIQCSTSHKHNVYVDLEHHWDRYM